MAPKKGQKNPNMARMEDENGRWDGGKSSDYRRRITKAKKGEIVHHEDHNKNNNKKKNLKKIKPGNGITAIGNHNKKHDRKDSSDDKTK